MKGNKGTALQWLSLCNTSLFGLQNLALSRISAIPWLISKSICFFRFWNLPQADLEVVDFKPVCFFLLSSAFHPLGRGIIEKPTASGYLHSVPGGQGWESRKTCYHWCKERWWQVNLKLSTQGNLEREQPDMWFVCRKTLKLHFLCFVSKPEFKREFIQGICKPGFVSSYMILWIWRG